MYLRILLLTLFTSQLFFAQNLQTIVYQETQEISIQKNDSITLQDTLVKKRSPYKQFIVPAILISYGLIGTESSAIKDFNVKIKETVNRNIDKKTTIDDFTLFVPAATVFALDAIGIKGKNNVVDQSLILTTSYLLVVGSTFPLKDITHIQRPDGTTYNSFPSGHTAIAFAGAEFLRMEYKNVNKWYGISGYIVAAGTGFFRMFNDRHWLTDVAAGAGIGILCTKAAYWLYPKMQKLFFKNETKSSVLLSPFYSNKNIGIGLIARL